MARDLNLAWNEALDFAVVRPGGVGVDPEVADDEVEVLEGAVPMLHDVSVAPS